MMTLEALIKDISGWQSATSEDIFEKLSAKDIVYRDDEDWTWKGIAGVINKDTGHRFGREGCKQLQNALKAAGEELWISQISAGMPLTDNEIQGILLYLDTAGLVPGARYIAYAVLRNESLLEKHNLETTLDEITQTLKKMKFELYKQSKIDSAQDRVIAYREAMMVYNGIGPEPVL